jgi:hypothetical protein
MIVEMVTIAETKTREKPRLGLGLWGAEAARLRWLGYGGAREVNVGTQWRLGWRAWACGGAAARLRRRNGELAGAGA